MTTLVQVCLYMPGMQLGLNFLGKLNAWRGHVGMLRVSHLQGSRRMYPQKI